MLHHEGMGRGIRSSRRERGIYFAHTCELHPELKAVSSLRLYEFHKTLMLRLVIKSPVNVLMIAILFSIVDAIHGQSLFSSDQAGTFVLSRSSDFSSQDRSFERSDVLHIKIETQAVDFARLSRNEFSLAPVGADPADPRRLSATLTNTFDGTYLAEVDLNSFPEDNVWVWQGRVEDEFGNRFGGKTVISVGEPAGGTSQYDVIGVIESINVDRLVVAGLPILITDNTEFENFEGEPIELENLAIGDLIEIGIEFFNDTITSAVALHIGLKRPVSFESLTVTGRIDELSEALVEVEDLEIDITADTRIVGLEEDAIDFSDLSAGDLVRVFSASSVPDSQTALLIVQLDEDRPELVLRGAVSSTNGNALVVQGTLFDVSEQTVVYDSIGLERPFSQVQAGEFVEIRAFLGATALPLASTIQQQSGAEESIWVQSTIDQVLDGVVVVQGRTFLVQEETRVVDENGQRIPASFLSEGRDVTVYGIRNPSTNELSAVLIQLTMDGRGKIEASGRILEYETETIYLGGVDFDVGEATLFRSSIGSLLDVSELTTGMYARVRGTDIGANALNASVVQLEPFEASVAGPAEFVGEELIRIGRVPFIVDEDTDIVGFAGSPITLDQLPAGTMLAVDGDFWGVDEAQQGASLERFYLASKVAVLDDVDNQIEAAGIVEGRSADRFELNGSFFFVDEETRIQNNKGELLPFESLRVNDRVTVEALYRDGPSFTARSVVVGDRFPEAVSGTIRALDGEVVRVAEINVLVTAQTRILDSSGIPISRSDLEVGDIVHMGLTDNDGASPTAFEVRLRSQIEDEVFLSGSLEQVEAESITVAGRKLVVTSNTRVVGESGNEIDPEDLAVNAGVFVRADLLPGDVLLALEITSSATFLTNVLVSGPINRVQADSLEVVGVSHPVDVDVEILDRNGESLDLSALSVGVTVDLYAEVDLAGERIARRVRVRDVALLSAAIADVSETQITLLGKTYALDAAGLIVVGERNEVLGASVLRSGLYVQARAMEFGEPGQEPDLRITSVKILGEAVVSTALEDLPRLTRKKAPFSIDRNYPNPFSDFTKFSIDVHEAGHVQLSIYSLLGQEVRRITDRFLSPGRHVFEWNGQSETGRPLASGIYLYSAQMGNVLETRHLVLVR